jgi:hypothetical protein
MVNDVCCNADNDVLRNLTLYRVDNVLNRIQMGQNPHGIFMCAVINIMYTVQHGIILYAQESIKSYLNPKKLQMLDKMAIQINATFCQSIQLSFSRANFSSGITSLTSVERSEQSGALFLIATLIMLVVECWTVLTTSFHSLKAVLGTMECILCFEAWLDQAMYWEIGNATGEAERAKVAIASMMRLTHCEIPSTTEELQKVEGQWLEGIKAPRNEKNL